jgi:hypothetical protein
VNGKQLAACLIRIEWGSLIFRFRIADGDIEAPVAMHSGEPIFEDATRIFGYPKLAFAALGVHRPRGSNHRYR